MLQFCGVKSNTQIFKLQTNFFSVKVYTQPILQHDFLAYAKTDISSITPLQLELNVIIKIVFYKNKNKSVGEDVNIDKFTKRNF